ncbi:hypothetical protein GH714_027962 [Hevea brasiliensis]|uniref:WEB family protein n=1 Tax=Hevea brasiliensis TaxID=3981 RepID=A0A6A6KLY3_HEVBR|nr:hypothetical protein GH714_027962 [Hevea brasiliensis]
MNCVKRSEEENSSLEREIDRLVNLLKQTEEEACATREEEAQLKDSLNEVEAEVISLQEALGESKVENMKLKESLLDKENELRSLFQENKELRTREAISLTKVEELSKLLEEAMTKKKTEENGELTDSEKDYDLLPKVVEFSEENGHVRAEKPKMELPPQQHEDLGKENSQEHSNGFNNQTVPMEAAKIENMWESCKIEKKEFSPERELEQESFEDEVESKVEGGESFDQINGLSSAENVDDGGSSPSKQQQQKKKKPLLRKFGSLLKKKSTSNQK